MSLVLGTVSWNMLWLGQSCFGLVSNVLKIFAGFCHFMLQGKRGIARIPDLPTTNVLSRESQLVFEEEAQKFAKSFKLRQI